MKKLSNDWFVAGLKKAAEEVASWPEWKQRALQTSARSTQASVQKSEEPDIGQEPTQP